VLGAASVAGFIAGDRTAQAGLEQTLNVLGMLEQRSPGARTGAELTKHRRSENPFEHALGPAFPPEAVSDVTEGLGMPSPEQLLAADEPDTLSDLVITPTAGAGGSSGSFPTFVAFGGGGGGRGNDFRGGGNDFGGGGSGGGGGDTPTGELVVTTQSLVPPAVPEPGTWATMLVGMGLCGFALRRRKRHAVRSAGQACAIA
jgi:hypothetical protein